MHGIIANLVKRFAGNSDLSSPNAIDSGRQLRAILDVLDFHESSVLVVDNNFRAVAVNQVQQREARHVLGREVEIGGNIFDVLASAPEQIREESRERWLRAFNGETFTVSGEIPDPLNDGRRVVYQVTYAPVRGDDGTILGGVALTYNVTEQTRTQEALQIERNRLEAAVRNTNLVLFEQDTELRYTWTHDPYRSEFASVLIGHTDAFWLERAEDIEALEDAKRDVIETGQGVQQMFKVRRKGDAADTYYDLLLQPTRNKDGEIIGITGAAMDVTEIQKMQQALMEAMLREREIEQERQMLDMREEFIAMISHDFREPLAVIMSAQSMLRRYGGQYSLEKRVGYLVRIEQQVKIMNEMIDDVLTYYRFQAGKQNIRREGVNLQTFCRDLFEEFQQHHTSPQHKFIFDDQLTDEIVIQADPGLLRRILYNLLSNALKYSPKGGVIHLKLEHTADGKVVVRVSDEGVGIPPDDMPNLFKPFYRARNVGEFRGTGLGLSVVYQSVKIHAGTITCDSTEGRGTTFTVQLPAS